MGDYMNRKKIFIVIIIIFVTIFSYFISYFINLKDIPSDILNIFSYKYQDNKSYQSIDLVSITINYLNINKDFINKKIDIKKELVYNDDNPIIYIYNTHSEEEYSYSKNNSYNIVPTVKEANYILENELKKIGIYSFIEQSNTTKIVNERGLPYSASYKVSREFLENRKMEYPTLEYFIDIHRDSVERNITTININGISYARVMFLLGLENENYLENKKVMTSLNNYLEENYKGLSRGIYEKKGKGVNGVYNQDFNKNVMLIEVGGVDNTIDEVSNSIKVIAKMLANYINSNKSTNID